MSIYNDRNVKSFVLINTFCEVFGAKNEIIHFLLVVHCLDCYDSLTANEQGFCAGGELLLVQPGTEARLKNRSTS